MAFTRGLIGVVIGSFKPISGKLFSRQRLIDLTLIAPASASQVWSGKNSSRFFHQFQITLMNEVQPLVAADNSLIVVKEEMSSSPVPPPKAPSPTRMRRPTGIISPPLRKGMLELDREAFDKDIKIPTVYVYEDSINPQTLQKFKRFMLKIRGMKPVGEAGTTGIGDDTANTTPTASSTGSVLPPPPEEDEATSENTTGVGGGRKIKKVFINPELMKGQGQQDLTHFVQHEIQPDPAIVSSVGYETVKFKYENWTLNQIIDSVLPDEDDKVSGFSQIGPIVHVNLRDHVLPYKSLIGQVFLDKISNAKTVVNKINIIESKYRNFQMELLAGDPNTVVTVKENRCEFEFDFATVYWNPRLSSEHDRLVKLIEPGEVLYDVFAGVGPFTIPAAKKKVHVIANDLNPDSFKWLQHNVKKNKVGEFVQCFNLDGRAFIQEAASSDLEKQLNSNNSTTSQRRFHFAMNLPALAVEFLDAFWGILAKCKDRKIIENNCILVHVYCFIKDVDGFKEKAVKLVKDSLVYDLPAENIHDVAFVRNVAPNKEMMRVSFSLPEEVLVGSNNTKCTTKRKFCEIDGGDESLD